jgi:hypothetical protein
MLYLLNILLYYIEKEVFLNSYYSESTAVLIIPKCFEYLGKYFNQKEEGSSLDN